MAICKRLNELLSEEHAAYQLVRHKQEFGAQRVAASVHIPGRDVAKVVIVRDGGGEFVMLVVPSQARLDLHVVALATGREGLRLAQEKEFAGLFPDCEAGAMPPVGRLYGMPMYVDGCFRAEPEIYFPAGTHHEVIRMRMRDYLSLARPVVGQWCFHRQPRAA